MKFLYGFFFLFFLHVEAGPSGKVNSYRICVPKMWLTHCEEMSKIDTKTNVEIQCVPARDRMECLQFIQQRHADFIGVEPEEMYLGSKIPNEDFHVFQEIRTIEEPEAVYRYQAIMVIKNSNNISSLAGLKGLKTCHTGINRNVGYKIPLTMLMHYGVIGPMNDLSLTPKENELKALSQLFSKSCIVGKWSPDPKTNANLKAKYSNLCAMCEHPDICDYPDNFSGYDGSLRCLADNNGDVAFTKMIYVRMHFGMQVGVIPARETDQNPDDYSYLCSDGSRVPVRNTPCAWAARPWPGYMSHQDILSDVNPLRSKLRELAEIGLKSNATWFKRVLGLNEWVHYLYDSTPITPEEFLTKTNYTIVIERGHGEPEQVVRMCVTSDVALSKCKSLSLMAYAIDIRPRIVCVQHNSPDDCLQLVKDNKADATAIPGYRIHEIINKDGLTPMFSETYRDKITQRAVAVVKKGSGYNSWNDLNGKRSCHNSYSTVEGFAAPINSLLKKGLIKDNDCSRIKYLSKIFSGGSCLPDMPPADEHEQMQKQCKKDTDNNPITCLDDNRADVAFVSNSDIESLDDSKYELICLNNNNGGRAPLSEWKSCNLMEIPPLTWVGVTSRARRPTDSATHAMLTISEELTKYRVDLFDMFGEYLKHNNVIFTKSGTGLISSEPKWFEDYHKIHNKVFTCA